MTTSSADRPPAAHRPAHRLSGPGELLQAVPYLLGFHPHRSLVLIGLRDGALVVTARLDLADVRRIDPVEATLRSMCDAGTREIVAVWYPESREPPVGDRPERWDAGPDAAGAADAVVDAVLELIDDLPCRLSEALVVRSGRWRGLLCVDLGCCPRSGRPLPAVPTPFAIAATVDGVDPLPDRAALGRVLDPLPEQTRAGLHPLLAAAENEAVAAVLDGRSGRHGRSLKRALFAAARASDEPGWPGPEDAEVARFAAGLTSLELRDAVWLAVDDGRLDGRPLWRALARRAPSPYDAGPLFLFGWATWRAGDGALAGMAAERAVAADPGYSAADLLLAALSRGLDPRRLPRLRRPA